MELYYNGEALHQLGELTILEQTGVYEPPAAPQREKITLRVRLNFFQPSHADNYQLVTEARRILRAQEGVLQWVNENGHDLLNRTVTLAGTDLPEDPNSAGKWHQQINLVFTFENHDLTTNTLAATYTPVGGLPAVLGNVTGWDEALVNRRFGEMRDPRQMSGGRIRVTGFFSGDMALELAARRNELLDLKTQWLARFNGSAGVFSFGDFSQSVRVEEFTCQVDQPNNVIEWSLTGSFTRFPDEANYSWCEFQVNERDDGADRFLTITGKVAATTRALALAKLAGVRAAVLLEWGYLASRNVKLETTDNRASSAEGDPFLELTFAEEYRLQLVNRCTYNAVEFGEVTGWREALSAQRAMAMKDSRTTVEVGVTVTGIYLAGTNLGVADRRAQLLAKKEDLMVAANVAGAALVHGDFNQLVRVIGFECDIDPAVRMLQWTLTGTFTRHPDESNYTIVEYQVTRRDDGADGFLNLNARITADSETRARTKWSALRVSLLASAGFSRSLVLREESTAERVQPAVDAEVCTSVNFSEEYRQPLINTLAWTATGGANVSLGNVTRWSEQLAQARYDARRDARREGVVTVTAAGNYPADATLSMAARRTQLQARQTQWRAALAVCTGTLEHGDFTADARVTDFNSEIDPAVRQLQWTLTATFTVFPDEQNYAQVEYQSAERDDGSDRMLAITATVRAHTEAAARARWNTLRTTLVNGAGYSETLVTRQESQAANVDADTDGPAFIEVGFSEEYRQPLQNVLTWQRTGGPQITLGNVVGWNERYQAARYSPLRPHRSQAGGSVLARGKYYADATLDTAQRRAALLALKSQWMAEMNQKEGVLAFGAFTQALRVEEFTCDIDHAMRALEWSLTATYTHFPNEAGYALAEFVTRLREDKESGAVTLAFSGKIGAQSSAAARTKLTTLRSAAVGGGHVLLKQEISEANVAADTDGQTFIELTFEEEYRLGTGQLVGWSLSITSADDRRAGYIRRTYAGTVTARGSDYASARTVAAAQAAVLGDLKHQFQVSNQVVDQDQQTLTSGERLVTVQFTYEYQLKGDKIYLEVSSEVNTERFGDNTESVSGYVVAASLSAATTVYLGQVRTAYNGRQIRNERRMSGMQKLKTLDLTSGAEQAGYEEQFTRLEFSFQALKPKATDETAIRYTMEVRENLAGRERIVVVGGSVWAADEETATAGGKLRPSGFKSKAEKTLDDFLATLSLGVRVENTLKEDWDYFLGSTTSLLDDVKNCTRLDFNATFVSATSQTGTLLECEVSVDMEHSGIRWVAQGIPDGRTVMQNCGIQEGRRTVRGMVLATDETTARAWAALQKNLLTGTYEVPERVETQFSFVPLTAGVARGTGANARVVRLGFQYSEVVPNGDWAP